MTIAKDEELNRLSNENRQLTEWVYMLEAFIKTTSANMMPQSEWGKLKARLLSKRPDFLK